MTAGVRAGSGPVWSGVEARSVLEGPGLQGTLVLLSCHCLLRPGPPVLVTWAVSRDSTLTGERRDSGHLLGVWNQKKKQGSKRVFKFYFTEKRFTFPTAVILNWVSSCMALLREEERKTHNRHRPSTKHTTNILTGANTHKYPHNNVKHIPMQSLIQMLTRL